MVSVADGFMDMYAHIAVKIKRRSKHKYKYKEIQKMDDEISTEAWYKTMLWYRYTEMYVHTYHRW